MAMGTGSTNRRHLVAEINVTPLVDVMLVLLIIFMVTAPMMTQGVDVDLPETTSKPLRQTEKPVTITLNAKGEIFLDSIKGDRVLLRQQLASLAQIDKERQIFLNADKQVAYGLVVQVMADIKEAGFDKLGMVTKSEDK